MDWFRESVVGRTVDASIKWRYLTLGLTIAAMLVTASVLAGGHVKFRAFPDIDGNVIQSRILLPPGTPLARTETVVAQIVDAIKKVNDEFKPLQPGGRDLVEHIAVQFGTNVDANESGPHVATVSIDLLNAQVRNARIDEVLDAWRRNIGEVDDVLAINFVEFQVGPGGRAIKIRLIGPDLETLKRASLDMQGWLKNITGVLDLTDDLRPGKPEISLRLRDGAVALGLDASMIAGQLRAAFYGRTVTEIQVGPESYEIDVRLAPQDQNSLADLEYFTITLPNGQQVPIGAVTILDTARGYSRINRIDGKRVVTIKGDVNSTVLNVSELMSYMKQTFVPDFLARYPGLSLSQEGQVKEGATTGNSIISGFTMGLIGVFLILSYQFKSYIEPLAVMIAIPFAFIGVVFGHLFMGLDLSMPSILGFASLAGIVVNDSILLVVFIKLARAEGLSVQDAARAASRQRFRAVLLTSLTTIAGLLPLLLETSLQAQVLIPLVTSLAFGLMASTLLVLFLVPVLFSIFDDFGLTTAIEKSEADSENAVTA